MSDSLLVSVLGCSGTMYGMSGKYKDRAATETPTTKRCSKCDELKALDDFPTQKRGRKGVGAQCRRCWRLYQNSWSKRGRARASRREYKKTPKYKTQYREHTVLSKYGDRGLELERKRRLPDTTCSACGSSHLLRIDHCHQSNKVRDILCHNCNIILGLAADSPERLEALADYLKAWEEAINND